MALYDNIKGKLAQTGQSAATKVKDLSETVRLNTEISEIENQISDLYGKIGYEVYVAYKDDPIPEAAEMINQVTALHKQIEEHKQLLDALQASGVCPNCGCKVKPEMKFCINCGAKLPEKVDVSEVPKKAFCKNCGAPIEEGNTFCASCGAKL